MAAQMGIPLAALKGTGPGGRVIAADVKEPSAEEATTAKGAAPGAAVVPAGAEYIDLPNSNIRKVRYGSPSAPSPAPRRTLFARH